MSILFYKKCKIILFAVTESNIISHKSSGNRLSDMLLLQFIDPPNLWNGTAARL